MPITYQTTKNGFSNLVDGEQPPGIDSSFRLIIVAALRTKQLQLGSRPRIEADPLKRRNTSIALEEVKRGLITFRIINANQKTAVRATA
jgi:DNA-directed RNA polymerase omega subunit